MELPCPPEPVQDSRGLCQEGRAQDPHVGGYTGFLDLQGFGNFVASVRPERNAEQLLFLLLWGTAHACPWSWVVGYTRGEGLGSRSPVMTQAASSSKERLHLLERSSDSILGKGWEVMKSVL